ncbi:MAG: hypothetical protein HY554_03255 [Elusimicrobia bacterium]|nr:hypothetical protein [Elusimicrobiota bacterium]
MRKRDLAALGLLAALLGLLFAPLVLRPWVIPGNFGDLYSYHYPLRHLVASRLQAGEVPLWNPYIFAGVPLAANPQALLLYPPAQLHLFLPLAWAFSLDALFHSLLAAAGAFLLLRAWRLDRGGAAVLAAAYSLSPFLIYRISQGVPTHLAALAWAPWVWLAALTKHPLPLALTFGLQVVSGHPQFALVNAIALGLWGLIQKPRRAVALIPAAALGLFLVAAQVVPTLEYLTLSVRSVWSPGYALGYSLPPRYLLTLLWPRAFGSPLEPDFPLPPSEFFEMLGLYLGLAPLALACLGLARARGRPAAGLWALLFAGLFLALGANNPLFAPLQAVLKLDFLRVPARFSFLLLWGLWLAAAAGWRAAGPGLSSGLKAALAAFTVLDLGVLAAGWVYAQDPGKFLAPQPAIADTLRQATRIATAPNILSANKTMLYRARNATGYEAFYPAPIALYTGRSERGPAADGSRTYIENWDSPEMTALGVRYYLTAEKVPCDRPFRRHGEAYLYENPAAGGLVAGAERWSEPKAERVVAEVSRSGPVLVRQAFYPGWRAWGGGGELALRVAEGLFPVAMAPGGGDPPGKVHFVFTPGSWRLGLLLSLVSGFLVLGIAELRLRTWISSL